MKYEAVWDQGLSYFGSKDSDHTSNMAYTIEPINATKIETDPNGSSSHEPAPLEINSSKLSLDGRLGTAWLLRLLWDPVAKAAEALVAGSRPGMEGKLSFRLLIIGRHTATLRELLAQAAFRKLQFDVTALAPEGDVSLPFKDGAFDCAIALDWLPLIRSSQRERAVTELCRVARLGVLLANPFYTPEAAAAEQAVNAVHLAATGEDNPVLGRHLEYGLPELDRAQAWVSDAFAHVEAQPIEALATWQRFAGVAASDSDGEISAQDAGLAALLPAVNNSVQSPAYRSLVIGSSSPLASITTSGDQAGEFGALAAHLAIEAAAQRRALDRLSQAVTTERARESDQFRATVASLSTELLEREAYAEMLFAELNERESVVADQTAVIETLERRLNDNEALIQNLQSERDGTNVRLEETIGVLSAQLLDTEAQLKRITGTLGWRLLSRYGRIKYGFLLPVFRLFGSSANRIEPSPPDDNPE